MTQIPYPAAVERLAQASERIGSDPLLIQAAGGNTSVKDGDTLWVKASGLWLRDALRRPLFVPVSLSQVRARVQADEADPVGPAILHELSSEALRPSIETTLHALMPHRVVLHVHSVDAIAWAVMPDAQQRLKDALHNWNWGWVDYERPGVPLTRVVAQLAARTTVDILLMGNHGLVIGGDSVEEAMQRVQSIVEALHRPVRSVPSADLQGLERDCSGTGWQLPTNERAHAIATDLLNLTRAQRGVLYPDHVVFLGHQVITAPLGLDTSALRNWLQTQQQSATAPPFVALPGRGVLVRDQLPEAAQELLTCLADVLQRLPETPEPIYLAAEEALALANWEAEKFRKNLKR